MSMINLASYFGAKMIATSNDQNETEWRIQFEQIGETAVREAAQNKAYAHSEPQRQCAFRWLSEQEKITKLREQQIYNYSRWTFWAAVTAVVIGIISVFVAWLH